MQILADGSPSSVPCISFMLAWLPLLALITPKHWRIQSNRVLAVLERFVFGRDDPESFREDLRSTTSMGATFRVSVIAVAEPPISRRTEGGLLKWWSPGAKAR
ncbi:hypothetical protein BS78_02G274000 [Paspalum vaginatum]|nr:hypothetical protein BS78_02G274000 [Paspalum vaginatum]